MKHAIAILIGLLVAALPAAARAAALNPSVTVTGSVIRLGDLFSAAGAEADAVVAPAPALGTRATYSAAWLAATAHEHDLDWSPASDFDQATVERASRVLGTDAIAMRLLVALPAPLDGDATIRFDDPGLRILVPAEATDAMNVDGLGFDQRTGRFTALVTAPAGAPDAQRQRVSGRLVVEEQVPVPSRPVAANEVLTAAAITQIKLPRSRLAPDVVIDPLQLVGKSARHPLRANQPVRADDVQNPIVVHKDDLVMIELKTPTMELSAQGKALEDGAMGAIIRVANTQSNRAIDAIVAAPDLVQVTRK